MKKSGQTDLISFRGFRERLSSSGRLPPESSPTCHSSRISGPDRFFNMFRTCSLRNALVVAEHASGMLSPSSLSAVTAASKFGDVTMLVAGAGKDVADQAAIVDGVNQVILSNEGKNDLCTLIYRANTPGSILPLPCSLIAPLSNGLAENMSNAVVAVIKGGGEHIFHRRLLVPINAPIVAPTSHRVWPPAHCPTYNSLYPRGGPVLEFRQKLLAACRRGTRRRPHHRCRGGRLSHVTLFAVT